MPSKQQDVAKPNIFSVLFMTVEGEPMSFYLRPGPVKRKLQPLITAGGGLLCNVQQPGAILLIDPEERDSIPESTAHWYVSTKYIHDCIEKEEQLNLEDYRLNPDVVQKQSPRLSNRKDVSPPGLGGRVAYTPEEDDAILSYVSKHKTEIGGNRLWQQMEKQRVTSHSWQSMKYRYRVRLAKKQSEIEEVETTKEETKEEEDQDTEDAAPPQTHSETTDLTQIDAESTQPENSTEAQTSSCPQPEEPHVDPQIESIPAESTEPKTDASQTTISPQKENVPEDSQPAQPEPLPSTSSPKKPKEKEKASPQLVRPQRRSTRRQLELEETPYSKKLRSASTSSEQPLSSPQPSKKTKSAVKPASQKDITADEPPPKRTRGKSGATAAESQQEESVQATVSETVQADEESDSVPQTGEKKKLKRKLGILELATKEFEDESEPEDEAPHLQNPAETAALQPKSTDPLLPSSDTVVDAASTQSNPEPGPSLQETVQEAQASSSNRLPETSCPQHAAAERAAAEPAASEPAAAEPAAAEPAASERAAAEPAASEPAASEPAASEPAAAKPAAAEAVQATSKAHLFIFDNESQEEDSQSVLSHSTAAKPQPTVNNEAALSLTQVQLEEDKQRIRELISQTKQDLVCVTKALLRTSGDSSAALDLLLNPSSSSGPFWNRCDDGLLLSADPAAHRQLQEKYGEEGVAKRIVFLEVDG